ncbi:hypothetical protein [Paracoccus marcusii]|uniref:hypothetical protein n=1 Tax=Paracoccus marcusii TaxID=59779 RepID=UPI0032655D0B
MVAKNLVQHFKARVQAMNGKAMTVCMSRRICADLYDQDIAQHTDCHSGNDDAKLVKIVMTDSASVPRFGSRILTGRCPVIFCPKRAKDPSSPLGIVRDMWLTGFNALSMHTMYGKSLCVGTG